MYSIVIFLLAVDVAILFLWQCMDPLKLDVQIFPLEDPLNSNDDIKISPELEHCKSENHNFWLSKYRKYQIVFVDCTFLPFIYFIKILNNIPKKCNTLYWCPDN